MTSENLDLTGCARLLGVSRWRLRLLIWTRQFPRPVRTDAAGRNYWTSEEVQRWEAETRRPGPELPSD